MLRVGREFGETLGDEPVETVEPVIAHRVAFEKRVVLRSRQLDQAAVRQQAAARRVAAGETTRSRSGWPIRIGVRIAARNSGFEMRATRASALSTQP